MTTPRRRIVRPAPALAVPDARCQRRTQKLRTSLERERAAVARWLTRLKRACTALVKAQQAVARLERRMAQANE